MMVVVRVNNKPVLMILQTLQNFQKMRSTAGCSAAAAPWPVLIIAMIAIAM